MLMCNIVGFGSWNDVRLVDFDMYSNLDDDDLGLSWTNSMALQSSSLLLFLVVFAFPLLMPRNRAVLPVLMRSNLD